MFLNYLHSYNYVLRSYFYVMFFVYMIVLFLVEMFGNPIVSFSEQQRVLLWIVWLFVVLLGFVFGVLRLGWIGETLCCAVVVIVSTISSLKKWDEVWRSCCVRFMFRLSCLDYWKWSLNYCFLLYQERLNYSLKRLRQL